MPHITAKRFLLIASILLAVIISACVEQTATTGKLSVRMSADPTVVFTGSPVTIYTDVKNNDMKTYRNVRITVFDYAGFAPMEYDTSAQTWYGTVCDQEVPEFYPGEFKTLRCPLVSPADIPSSQTTKTVYSSVSFNSRLSAVQRVEILTEDEYNQRISTGTLTTRPKIYEHTDGNIALKVEFNAQMPYVLVPDQQAFVYLTFSNVGNGFFDKITKGQLIVRVNAESIIDRCDFTSDISIIGKEFPRITCELPLYADSRPMMAYDLVIELDYSYDIRTGVPITVRKQI